MDINDVLAVVNNEAAMTLALSKGGWEGWLQCELWRYLTHKGESAERELAYPGKSTRCDLFVQANGQPPLWAEIKAFGSFRDGDVARFLDSIAQDIAKLDDKPQGSAALALVVVPATLGDNFANMLRQRGWLGFNQATTPYLTIYHMSFV